MGTRSLTHIIDSDGKTLCTIYRQFDGYPTGHGQELADFLKARTLVNGYTGDMTAKTHANTLGCLAAQLIGHLKGDKLGGIYIYTPGASDCGEEYTYTIAEKPEVGTGWERKPQGVTLKCHDGDRIIFEGDPADFDGVKIKQAAEHVEAT